MLGQLLEGNQGHTGMNGMVQQELAGAAFSQTEVLAEAMVPLLSPPHTGLTGRCHTCVSINLVNTVHFTLVIPRPHTTTQLLGPPKQFPVAFPHKWPF